MSLALAAALALAPLVHQESRREEALEEFKEERTRILAECGQRHLEYGLELRKKGLTTQAATQILLAVEASLGRNPGANLVLRLMRTYEDAFWKRKPARPTPAKIAAYDEKAAKLRRTNREARLDLVRFAARKDLDEQAFGELRELLIDIDEPLVFDERGALVVLGGKIGGALAERVRADAIQINDRPYARDTFLRRMPHVVRIFEHTSAELRVRSTTSVAEAEALHAAAAALMPELRTDFGASPERRLQIVVLGERKVYDAYLDIVGLSGHKVADGFADRVAGTAVLCKEGSTPEFVVGLALHELVHLYQLDVSAAVLPSWYLEGSAETYGGEGTFRWDGASLATRGAMSPSRLDEVRAQMFPLRELLGGDALALQKSDELAARRFYAQSWAFLRFLEQGAGPEIAERLDRWRMLCLGSVAGAEPNKPYQTDSAASQQLFLDLFEKDLPALEEQFAAWLR